jgi:DNA (cytosine-5)-methyltransferase 1
MIKIIDLFAGIGGIRLGFEQAFGKENVDCVFSSEINKSAIETYKANFGNGNIYGDITKINAAEIPDHDILLAGFPCQPFSAAGNKDGFNDARGVMFFEIERILLKKKPPMFLLENVENLKNHDRGATFEIIKERLVNAGYKIFYNVLSGKDFGVPQIRRRLFIVGFLDHDVQFEFPKPLDIPSKVGDILEQNVDPKYTLSDKIWNFIQKKAEKSPEKRYVFTYKKYDKNSPYTRTLLAGYSGRDIVIDQPGKNPRKLTPRECARLQGFPDSFVIDRVSDNQLYKQFGNSVCVPVINALAKQIKKTLPKNIFSIVRTFFARILNI